LKRDTPHLADILAKDLAFWVIARLGLRGVPIQLDGKPHIDASHSSTN
jgi:hypothetical protein